MRLHSKRRGVSLVEVMVVIAIMLVLMTVMAVGVSTAWQRSQVSTTWLTLGRVAQDVQVYELTERHAPEQREGLAEVYPDEPIPRDAWGTEIQYEAPQPDWDLVSLGSDRAEGGTGHAAELRWSERRR